MSYELDPSVRITQGGRQLAGGRPPHLMRLSPKGAAALETILSGAPLEGAAAELARTLERRGMIAPLPPAEPAPAELTTVIPARDGGAPLLALVEASLARGPVIVVDDRSTDGSPERAAARGAQVLPNAGAPGPAGARNTGLRAARTELVAFVDADCAVRPGWADGLAAIALADPRRTVLAPRIRSAPGASRLARYERAFSPLDLGPHPGVVGRGGRIGYLPAAALLARREPLLEHGGFEEELRFGEDVDLIWRLVDAGLLVQYVPRVEVEHAPRPTLGSMLHQRRGYGSAAAALDSRHPGAASPLRAGPGLASVWLAGLLGGWLPAGAALTLALARAASKSRARSARPALIEIALRGQGHGAVELSRALSREWLPLTALAAAASPRLRRLAALALATDLLAGARERELDRASAAALRLLDNAAYSAGLWEGALRERSLGAVLPALRR